jgi:uncharacterized membrane protein YebE (DUF533 family)
VLNNVADVLGVVLTGTLGRSGRKRARRATKFLTGHRGFLSASTLMAAAGVAWGIYDTMKNQNAGTTVPGVPQVPTVPAASFPGGSTVPTSFTVPPIPTSVAPKLASDTASEGGLDPVARIIRLAVSAAKADGTLDDKERALIMDRAQQAGLVSLVEAELNQSHVLAEIVRGVTDPEIKKELYVLAFTIVRADENVSGAERIYLAQLAYQLGLDDATTTALETETAAKIDSQTEH